MDCLVVVTASDSGRVIEINGSASSRFRAPMERKVNETLNALGAGEVRVNVQDNGALDIVLGARVEAAYNRYRGCAE
jgi:citrate lyase subunit gamma (acyl carrier protein)